MAADKPSNSSWNRLATSGPPHLRSSSRPRGGPSAREDESPVALSSDYHLTACFTCSRVIANAGFWSSSALLRRASATPSSSSERTAGSDSSRREASEARALSGSFIAFRSISPNVSIFQAHPVPCGGKPFCLAGRLPSSTPWGTTEWKPMLADMFRLNTLWDSLPKCAFSRNHQFDQRLNGVEYVTKCLSGSALRDGLGGDFYEGSKFALRGAEATLRVCAKTTSGQKA